MKTLSTKVSEKISVVAEIEQRADAKWMGEKLLERSSRQPAKNR